MWVLAWRRERVCDCDGECVQRSVSSCRAWSGRERRAVSAPHPESPRNQPLLPWRTPTPLLQPRFSLVYSRSPPPCVAVFLSPIFRSTLCRNPCAPEQRVEGKMGKTRVGEIQCEFLLVDSIRKFDYFTLRVFICVFNCACWMLGQNHKKSKFIRIRYYLTILLWRALKRKI